MKKRQGTRGWVERVYGLLDFYFKEVERRTLSTRVRSSAASDGYRRQVLETSHEGGVHAAELGAPLVEGGAADAMLAA